MSKLTLEELVKLSEMSDKIVLPVENPCFIYKDTVLNCYTRAIDITTPNSIDKVYEAGIFYTSDYIESLKCEVIFVLSHDVAQIGEGKYRYKLRFATDVVNG